MHCNQESLTQLRVNLTFNQQSLQQQRLRVGNLKRLIIIQNLALEIHQKILNKCKKYLIMEHLLKSYGKSDSCILLRCLIFSNVLLKCNFFKLSFD